MEVVAKIVDFIILWEDERKKGKLFCKNHIIILQFLRAKLT